MRLNDDAMLEAAKRFVAERIESIKKTESAREGLDDLLEHLTEQGFAEEETFAVQLAAEEAIMRRFHQG